MIDSTAPGGWPGLGAADVTGFSVALQRLGTASSGIASSGTASSGTAPSGTAPSDTPLSVDARTRCGTERWERTGDTGDSTAETADTPDTAKTTGTGGTGGNTGGGGGAELIDQIRALEELKSAASAAQARVTARFAAAQRATQRAAGMAAAEVGKGVGAQVALARRDSPAKGARHLGLAEALAYEMPHTLTALQNGHISEWQATLVVRETACLTREHRSVVDAELAARPGGLEAMGDRTTGTEARRIAYRLEPRAVTARASKARTERRVSLRPAPDTMAWLSGLLPVEQGVAAYTALGRHADSRRAVGDPRSRGQIMADTLVERLTGQTSADAVPVEVNLVVTEHTLFGDDPEPADLEGYGPIPAPLARDWLRGDLHQIPHTDRTDRTGSSTSGSWGTGSSTTWDAGPSSADTCWGTGLSAEDTADDTAGETAGETAGGAGDGVVDHVGRAVAEAQVWLRRLYTAPGSGQLVAMESTHRYFTGKSRRFLIVKDRWCRTPWCEAPIRHADHPVPVAAGGQTNARTGQGLCEACNYTKEVHGWSTTLSGDGAVETTTPTGHRYRSRPPPPVGRAPRAAPPTAPRAAPGAAPRAAPGAAPASPDPPPPGRSWRLDLYFNPHAA